MVSQGAQTNGLTLPNGRKLTKSYSEAEAKFGQLPNEFDNSDHEPLQRTQSEEPPRSPYIVKTPPESPEHLAISENSEEKSEEYINNSDQNSDDNDNEELVYENIPKVLNQKEIIIDFEPQSSPVKKKPLLKTASDGEILLDRRRTRRVSMDPELIPDKVLTSISHDNICVTEAEPRNFTPYFQDSPIRHENIFKTLSDDFPGPSVHSGYVMIRSINVQHISFSSRSSNSFRPQDSLDEEFHENLIYRGYHQGIYRNTSASLSEQDAGEYQENGDDDEENDADEDEEDEEEDCVVPSFQTSRLRADLRISPFASTDSLTNDIR